MQVAAGIIQSIEKGISPCRLSCAQTVPLCPVGPSLSRVCQASARSDQACQRCARSLDNGLQRSSVRTPRDPLPASSAAAGLHSAAPAGWRLQVTRSVRHERRHHSRPADWLTFSTGRARAPPGRCDAPRCAILCTLRRSDSRLARPSGESQLLPFSLSAGPARRSPEQAVAPSVARTETETIGDAAAEVVQEASAAGCESYAAGKRRHPAGLPRAARRLCGRTIPRRRNGLNGAETASNLYSFRKMECSTSSHQRPP